MNERPEWTPDEQEIIDYWFSLDRVAKAIGIYMLTVSELPLSTITRLLPRADLAWRGKDISGALIFCDIDSISPRVTYSDNGVVIALHEASGNRCVVPLEPIFLLLSSKAKGIQ